MRRVRDADREISHKDIPLCMYAMDELDPENAKAGLLLSPLLFSVRGEGLYTRTLVRANEIY